MKGDEGSARKRCAPRLASRHRQSAACAAGCIPDILRASSCVGEALEERGRRGETRIVESEREMKFRASFGVIDDILGGCESDRDDVRAILHEGFAHSIIALSSSRAGFEPRVGRPRPPSAAAVAAVHDSSAFAPSRAFWLRLLLAMHSPRPTFPFAMPSPSSPPARSPTSSPTPAKSRRRTSSLALGLLALKSKDSSVHHPHDAMPPPPLRPPRDPRRSMTVDPRSSLALALMEDEPPMPQPVAPMRAKVRPSTADSVEQGAAGVQLRNSRSSASSRFMPKNGTRCPPSSVPYPRSYDRDVVDQ